MKKVLLILLCLPLFYSFGESEKKNNGECVSGDCENREGTCTYADGTVRKGLWENGEFIGE